VLVAFVASLLLGEPAQAKPVLMDGVAAVVGRRVITRSEVETEGRVVLVNRAGQKGLDQPIDDAFRRSVLDYLVVQELLVQEARRGHGVIAAENEVDRGVAAFKARFETDDAFRRFLVEAAVDEETVRTIVRRDLSVQALLARTLEIPDPSDQDVRRYLLAHPGAFAGAAPAARSRAASDLLRRERREKVFAEYVEQLKSRVEVRVVAEFKEAGEARAP
jgi:hypothetical protein